MTERITLLNIKPITTPTAIQSTSSSSNCSHVIFVFDSRSTSSALALNFSNFDIAGFDVDDILSNNGIDIEMADLFNIVLIVTPSNTQSDMDVLFDELIKITNNTPKAKSTLNLTPPPICKEKLFPQKAFFSNQRDTKLQNSIGHISCSTVVPYPPGVPVIYTGETIRKEQIDYIEYLETKGAEITGISNGTIAVSEQNNE